MNTLLKIVSIIISTCLLPQMAMTQEYQQRTLIKSFQIEQQYQLLLDYPGQVEIVYWDKPNMQIRMHINYSGDKVEFKSLLRSGHYQAKKNTKNQEYHIKFPGIEEHNNYEEISLTIFVPQGMDIIRERLDLATLSF